MIEPILKEITKKEYNKHKDDDDYIKQGCYNEEHGILYQIDNPPDYYKYYKIVGRRYFFQCLLHYLISYVKLALLIKKKNYYERM